MSFWSFLAGAAAGAAVTYVVTSQPRRSVQHVDAKQLPDLGGGQGRDTGWYVLMYDWLDARKNGRLKDYAGPFIDKTSAEQEAQAAANRGWDEPGKAKVVVKHMNKRPF